MRNFVSPLVSLDSKRFHMGAGSAHIRGAAQSDRLSCFRCVWGISPPAGGDLLFPWRKRRQNAPGTTPLVKERWPKARGDRDRLRMSAPRSYSPFPGPHYGGRSPERLCVISGAQNLRGWLNSRRATGPWVCKNCRRCGSISAPGFPSQRSRCEIRRRGGTPGRPVFPVQNLAGAPRGSPTHTRKLS